MTAKSVRVLVALVGLLACRITPAAATTLTFDDIVSAPTCNGAVAAGYGTFLWSNFQVECDSDYTGGFGNLYDSPSGDYAAFNASGLAASEVATAAGTFAFAGASFTSWAGNNAFDVFSAQELALIGYRPGDLPDAPTYYVEFALDPTQYVAQILNWTGLNDLLFISGAGVDFDLDGHNDFNIDGYSWLMDGIDISIEQTPVPEPSSAVLVGAALVALAGVRRRALRQSREERGLR